MLPVLGREVVEGEQRVAILDQALDRLVIFDAPGLDEGVEGGKRILLGLRHPDFLQRPLGFRLLAVRQFVEDVGGFVHPAALAAGLRPYLFDRLPEPERTIGDRELGANREPTPLEIEEQFAPRVRTLAHAVGEADKLLPALGCGSDDDQQALRGIPLSLRSCAESPPICCRSAQSTPASLSMPPSSWWRTSFAISRTPCAARSPIPRHDCRRNCAASWRRRSRSIGRFSSR